VDLVGVICDTVVTRARNSLMIRANAPENALEADDSECATRRAFVRNADNADPSGEICE